MKNIDINNKRWIISSLKNGVNPSFRYYMGTDFVNYLVKKIFRVIEEYNEASNIIYTLIKYHDYRYIAVYLHAIQYNDKIALKIIQQISKINDEKESNKLLFKLNYAYFCKMISGKRKANPLIISSLDKIFSQSNQGIAIYFIDSSLESTLIDFINKIGVDIGIFIEQQFDIPGLNALVRQGVVRTWFIPDGKVIVSKQNNPQKPGRLCKELFNYEAILFKMGGRNGLYLGNTLNKRDIWLKIAQPFAVIWDGYYSKQHYALSLRIDGISLEDLLMNEHDHTIRCEYLAHCRLILDACFERGILWGDMSPRNILVQQTEQNITYYIFDFEKTQILNKNLSIEKRREYCRGQICVEEFGIICTAEEMQVCFYDYFNSKDWDFESKDTLCFPMRAEVADILNGRGSSTHDTTLGSYNQTDFEMMNARTPLTDPVTGERRFPGHLNFKVEHYLSCAGYKDASDYERKTTEILIAAKQHDCFDTIVIVLNELTDNVESAFLKAEFETILYKNSACCLMSLKGKNNMLANVIDILYSSRKHGEIFTNIPNQWIKRQKNGHCYSI